VLASLALGCGRDSTVLTSPPEQRAVGARPAEAPPAVSSGGSGPVAAAAGAGGASAGGGSGAGGAASAPPAAAASALSHHSVPGRLIAIGDLHGDLAATRQALRLGGAIDESDRWIGKNLSVVQTGDQLDRGDEEREILDLFQQLKASAAEQGGQVIPLNGNHEVMNAQGDYRYVTPAGIGAFAGVRPRSPLARSAPPPFEDRAAAFLPGGAYARVLAERDVIAVVGDSAFVHGGVLPAHVGYGIERINRETQAWLRGEGNLPAIVASETGPIWVRDYSLDPVAANTCDALGQVLAALGARRMVVGHTVQKTGITSACDDRVYRIDVGLSRYYGEGAIQVLEIDGAQVRTLSAPRENVSTLRSGQKRPQ
jgi:hypothetical protein